MPWILLVATYTGLSDASYEASVEGGRKIPYTEAQEIGFLPSDVVLRHAAENYNLEWYEVRQGSRVTLRIRDDTRNDQMVFEFGSDASTSIDVPLDIPQELDDGRNRGYGFQSRLEEWLVKHCRRVS